MNARALMLLSAAVGLLACEDSTDPEPTTYSATLLGANERPSAVTTSGTGSFTATLNSSDVLTYNVTWTGLSSVSNNAHIHGPLLATSGNAALGVLIDFNAPASGRTITHGVSGSATGTIDFNVALSSTISGDSLKKLFDTAKLYVNVHTTTNPGGEVLGFIQKN